jgi:hypothetical protein
MAMTERMAWNNIVVGQTDLGQEEQSESGGEEESLINTISTIPDVVDRIAIDESFSQGLVHIQNQFMIKVHGPGRFLETSSNRIHYKKGIRYLEELVDPDNDELARLILRQEDYIHYKEEVSRMQSESEKQEEILLMKEDSSYYAKTRIMLGAVYELFYTKASHTPFLDLLNQVRTKIMEYVRKLRDNYNYYSDLIQDTGRELTTVAKKTAVAWERAKWLAASSGVLVAQVGEILVDDVAPLAIEYVKYIL